MMMKDYYISKSGGDYNKMSIAEQCLCNFTQYSSNQPCRID